MASEHMQPPRQHALDIERGVRPITERHGGKWLSTEVARGADPGAHKRRIFALARVESLSNTIPIDRHTGCEQRRRIEPVAQPGALTSDLLHVLYGMTGRVPE